MSYLSGLKSEITIDPLTLGYAALLAAGNHVAVAAILNAATGPGAATITLPSVTHDQFLSAIRPALVTLPSLSAAIQAKWSGVISMAESVQGVVVIDPNTIGLLNSAVADGVLTQAQADAAYHRTGSRTEFLFGAGTVVAHLDIANALKA